MKTQKGIFTQVGRFGLYHDPSSKLMNNFLEIYGQEFVNVRPIFKEWTKIIQGKLVLDSRYEDVFVEIYCKVFDSFIQPFDIIYDFKAKVDKYNSSKTKENHFLIETLTIYVQKYIKQEKKIPAAQQQIQSVKSVRRPCLQSKRKEPKIIMIYKLLCK